ncbi:hypothetical protein Sste5346_007110 [Sporothrix stenoceras]|uniref:Uncharacterized protein n=1 Tax=Sporothrix stenoceras TaxID=5173 RepID=A0ABR3YWU6_9PEZI
MLKQTFEEQCRGAISLVPVYFSIISGQVRTQSDAPLQTILGHVLHQLAGIHLDAKKSLDLSVIATSESEASILRTIYDADTLPLVLAGRDAITDTDTHVVELLDPQQKARLLVEGIAGAVAIVKMLTTHSYGTVTLSHLQHELHRFSSSARPQHIRDAVEHSRLFGDCLMMSQILDLIMDAAHDHHSQRTRRVATFDDYSADVFCSERERAAANNMGMPWGLEFMMLN